MPDGAKRPLGILGTLIFGVAAGVTGAATWHTDRVDSHLERADRLLAEQVARCDQQLELCRSDCYAYIQRLERWLDQRHGMRDSLTAPEDAEPKPHGLQGP